MCFDYESLPPIPVIAGAAVSHTDLELRSADGTVFAAFAALPDEPSAVGVVVLPDVRGLYRFYEELALRFAERGYAAARNRLLRPHRRRREARRPLRVHGARRADHSAPDPGRRCGRDRVAALTRRRLVRIDLHGRLLLRRAQLVARSRKPGALRGSRLLRQHRRAERTARAGRSRLQLPRADPGASGRRRRPHHGRGQRRVRPGSRLPPASSTSS